MEDDHIKREDAWNGIYNCPTKRDEDGYIWVRTIDVAHKIDEIPAADVVDVVRCADCKWSQYDELFHSYWCEGCHVDADFFCANGKRKENDGRNADESN